MARVAVVAGPDPGHAFPAVALALRLRDRGHRVLVCSGDRWSAAVAAAGLAFAPLPLLAPDPRDSDFGFVLWGRGALMAPPLADLLRGFGPDVVVADTLTVAGWFAADLLGVPRVELVPHALPPRSRGVSGWLEGRALRRGAAQRAAARHSIGLPPDRPPAIRLVATLPALEPGCADVVGPLEWDPAVADLPDPPGPGPLVFLADSTASDRPQTLLAVAMQAGYRIACTTFSPVPLPAPVPGVVAGPGRQAPLLDRAAAVVCAGGHGMVAKALSRGLPLVVVPGPGDQGDNARRVVALGAGVAVPPRQLSSDRLRAALRTVLEDPAYAAAARRARDSLAALEPDLAARRVEAVLA